MNRRMMVTTPILIAAFLFLLFAPIASAPDISAITPKSSPKTVKGRVVAGDPVDKEPVQHLQKKVTAKKVPERPVNRAGEKRKLKKRKPRVVQGTILEKRDKRGVNKQCGAPYLYDAWLDGGIDGDGDSYYEEFAIGIDGDVAGGSGCFADVYTIITDNTGNVLAGPWTIEGDLISDNVQVTMYDEWYALVTPQVVPVTVTLYDDSTGANVGSTTFNVRVDASMPPPAPTNPAPPDGASNVPPSQVSLSWALVTPLAAPKVIYGSDDRLDIYEVSDPPVLAAWDSTVVQVPISSLTDNGNGTYSLPGDTYAQVEDVCSYERFADQPVPGWCSGFLVGDDLIATAGHCMEDVTDCANYAFVFGFQMLDASTPVLTSPASEIYYCNDIVDVAYPGDADWSIVELDRAVTGHAPLPVRDSGQINDSQSLLVIGHPMGLPAKVAGGANVRDNTPSAYFVANLDSYSGNSGSAVFNADSLTVEGILVKGETDLVWVPADGCYVSLECPDDGCSGEDVTRSTEFAHLLTPPPPFISFDVYFGECPNMQYQGSTADMVWPIGELSPGIQYCWQIVATSDVGTTPGPEWSFTTSGASCSDGVDNDGDGFTDYPDDPGCLDANDSLETDSALPCDDGVDNDGDQRIDFDPVTFANPGDETTLPAGSGDPGCKNPTWFSEDPRCQNGVDDDRDGTIDYDAGLSRNGAADPGGPDLYCVNVQHSYGNREMPCGLGTELALLLPPLMWLYGRRSRA